MDFSSKRIRKDFINFFENKKHTFVRSSPVMPIDDETLLFTNAGMNQFKKIFLGQERPKSKRVVNSQKCIRVSGKHNDLEEVGADEFHHTFFEMLGNWSFGDFYKKEIIIWSWELLTEVWKLDKQRLWVTVYKDDDEAEQLWKEYTDVNHDRVLKFGNKDNFWEMGETGPCGPCSEIHFYIGNDLSKQESVGVNRESEYRELWNLVFIEFNRKTNGELEELPMKHVDTGAGLERLVATLNKTTDHYKTDLFLSIVKEIEKISGKDYGFQNGMPHRVISDHLRMVSFSLADGVMPSNEGRGYVVRRILRRAIRFGRVLGIKGEFLYNLVDVLIKVLGNAYPELSEKKNHIKKVIESEEVSFGRTLDRGLILFDEICSQTKGLLISGEDAFKLYDTYGFPLDLTQLLAKEKKLKIDKKKFNILMSKQKELARSKGKFSLNDEEFKWHEFTTENNSDFVGYDIEEIESNICMYRFKKSKIEIVVSKTPFYAESGGQIGDVGKIVADNFTFVVEDTYKDGDKICHLGTVENGEISDMGNVKVMLKIDSLKRGKIKLNHTGTHLLHKALKIVLGDHVQQAGSLVSDEKLRFDLTHYQKINNNQIVEIENTVNRIIKENIILNIENSSFVDAKKGGAEALFGEKYGDEVRVVDIKDFSKELCGGTHVNATGDIGLFKIVSESSLASGVRRIEAVTGEQAFSFLRNEAKIINSLKNNLKCDGNNITDRINEFEVIIKNYKLQIKQLINIKVKKIISDLDKNQIKINKYKLIKGIISLNIPPKDLHDVVFEILNKNSVGLIGIQNKGVNTLVCSVTKDINDKIKAGSLVKEIANKMGFNAGGSPHMAITNFKNKELLEEAINIGLKIIKGQK